MTTKHLSFNTLIGPYQSTLRLKTVCKACRWEDDHKNWCMEWLEWKGRRGEERKWNRKHRGEGGVGVGKCQSSRVPFPFSSSSFLCVFFFPLFLNSRLPLCDSNISFPLRSCLGSHLHIIPSTLCPPTAVKKTKKQNYCEAMKFDSLFQNYKIYIYRLQELLVLLILVPLLAVSVITGHLLWGPTTGPLPCGRGTLSQSVPVAWRHALSHLSPILPLQSGVPADQFDRRDNTLRHAAAAEQPLQTYSINKNKTMEERMGGGKNNDSSGLMGRSSCQRLESRLAAETHKPQLCFEAAGASG